MISSAQFFFLNKDKCSISELKSTELPSTDVVPPTRRVIFRAVSTQDTGLKIALRFLSLCIGKNPNFKQCFTRVIIASVQTL